MTEFKEMIGREGQDGVKLLFADLGQMKSLALDPLPNVYEDGVGNVGINTTSPSAKLDVVATVAGTVVAIENTGGTATLEITNSTPISWNLGVLNTDAFAITEVGVATHLRIQQGGNVGLGTASPQGVLQAYDTISGFLLWEFDGLDATVRTVIPNGAGDVLYRLVGDFIYRDSAGALANGQVTIDPGGSTSTVFGTSTVRLRVNADGSTDIARTAGANTIKVALTLRWL